MMAQSWSMLDEPLRRSPTQAIDRQLVDDEDLFDVALLFLDQGGESLSDDCSDSFSVQASDDSQVSDFPMTPSPWAPTSLSFQEQLAEVSMLSPVEPSSLFVDTSAPIGFESQVWNPSQAKPTTPPRRINKRRLEIERLRVESQTLQKRLMSLQDHATEPDVKMENNSANRVLNEVLGSAWQNIAARQLEQLQRSENENRRLKTLVNEHKRMAKALRRLVARHANAKAWDPLRSRTRQAAPNRPGSFDAMDDPAVFEELGETLSSMYEQIDTILADPKLATKDASTHDVETQVDSHDNMRVQVLASRTLPFHYEASSEALWDYMFHHCGPKALKWEATAKPDTFQADFVAYTEMYHFKGLGRAKMMLRRIDEPHRIIILRSALFQCPGGDDDATGLRRPMRHCLWKVMQKPSHVDAPSNVSQIVSYEMLMPTLEVDGVDDDAREHEINTLTAMCTQIAAFHAKQSNEWIDNRLLQRTVESPRDVAAVIC